MFGPVTQPENKSLQDLNLREFACLLPLVALAFWIGIYPAPFFRYIDPPSHKLVEHVNPTYFKVGRARLAVPPPAAYSGDAHAAAPAGAVSAAEAK
jgi:NADH-quinone oxidoreductase subunit M